MSKHLHRINSPADLKRLSPSQLDALAAEIRELLVDTVSKTGGHLAPNLGVVELTIALHRTLDPPQDKIVWDVSHQSYVHKLLTGRRDQIGTLRQEGGLSGFCRRCESEYDAFGAGHGSTSISAALGLAQARDLAGRRERVVAVIGDGALMGGLALEGLNQAGQLGTDLLVVLNDNEMSISPTVGAMARHLSRFRADPHLQSLRQELRDLMKYLPLGDAVVELADRFEEGVRHVVVPGALFEALGFTYLGPIDGHNIGELMGLLERAKELRGPVLLHVLTVKGKGYGPAEKDPREFHGTTPFDAATGRAERPQGAPTYSHVFGDTMLELAARDERVVAITAAMMDGTGLDGFAARYPDRCFDVGMCEEHAVTFAAGLACAGRRPVVAVYSTFLQRAYDQIVHDVCLQGLPVVFALDRAGVVGDDGPTHHGLFDIAYLRHIPGMVCMAPKDASELRHMLATALKLDGPCALRYPRGETENAALEEELNELQVGRAQRLRDGADATILALGPPVWPALRAAEKAESLGLRVGVVNLRFIKPLDREAILAAAQETHRLVTVEEGCLAGGCGSAVLELLQEAGSTDVRVHRIGVPDEFVEQGEVSRLRRRLGLDEEGILASVVELCRNETGSACRPAGRRREGGP